MIYIQMEGWEWKARNGNTKKDLFEVAMRDSSVPFSAASLEGEIGH